MSEGAPPTSAPQLPATGLVSAAPSASYSPEQLSRVKADLLEAPLPESIGGYRIRRLLGAGGMGSVYEAEQDHPHRVVALKVIHAWAVSPSALRRFEVEAEALARLEHPYVARIYAVGADAAGAPFLAMERVKGGPLSAIPGRQLSVRERLDLLARICDGVHYAHQRGVIHRDLKPSNIMVDEEGRPRILDFGVARLTDSDLRATTTSSKEVLVGTLPYMSPEQLGAGGDPDTRSDVYALGVIGYELLTGRLPLPVQDKPIGEAARIIRETEPKFPSSNDKALRGDVDAILMKALAKDPAQRYPSAAAMADDLRRCLSYEPVTARRLTSSYQLGRFVLRNPLLTSLLAAVLFALTAGLAGTAYGLLKSRRLQTQAEGHLQDAITASNLARDEARRAELQLAKGLVAQGDALDLAGMHADARGRFIEAADRLSGAGASTDPADVAWLASCQLSPPPLVSLSIGRGAPVNLGFDPSGMRAWWADASGPIHLADLRTGRTVKSWNVGDGIAAIWFCPKRDTAFVSSSRGLLALDLDLGTLANFPPPPRSIAGLAGSDDGRLLLAGDDDGGLWLYDVQSRKLLRRFTGRHTKASVLALSADGSLALSAGGSQSPADARWEGTLDLWDATHGTLLHSWPAYEKDVTGLLFLPDGGAISAGLDQTIKRWDLHAGRPALSFAGQTAPVTCVALSRDGKLLLSGAGDGAVVLWDVQSGRLLRRFEGRRGIVTSVAFSADGRSALSGASDGTMDVWDLNGQDAPPLADAPAPADRAAISSDGKYAAVHVADRVQLIDCAAHRLVCSAQVPAAEAGCLALAAGGTELAWGDENGNLRIWSPPGAAPKVSLKTGQKISALQFTPDGGQLVVGREDGRISIRQAGSGRELRLLSDEQLGVTSLAVSKDGRMLLSGSFDHVVRLWDLAQGRVIFRLEGHAKSVNCVAFALDAKHALSGSADQKLILWDLDSGQLAHAFAGHASAVAACAFSGDGRWALSAGEDGSMRTWDVAAKTAVGILPPGEKVLSIACAPDGWRALTESLRFWDFSRAGRYRQLEAQVAAAISRPQSAADDPRAPSALDQWFIFRGRPQWAPASTTRE